MTEVRENESLGLYDDDDEDEDDELVAPELQGLQALVKVSEARYDPAQHIQELVQLQTTLLQQALVWSAT